MEGDVSSRQRVVELFRAARDKLRPVKFLVNNAATFHVAPVVDLGVEAFDEVMAVNARGTFSVRPGASRAIRSPGAPSSTSAP